MTETNTQKNETGTGLEKKNYIGIGIGVGLLIIGYAVLAAGSTVAAPFLIVGGYIVIGISIVI